MTDELDIYRTARMLINEHDDEAPIHAAMRADKQLEAGDLDGQAVWLRALTAVKELLTTKPPPEKTVH